MATTVAAVDTGHTDMIVRVRGSLDGCATGVRLLARSLAKPRSSRSQHDAQLDYFSRRLATCSSDRVIKIYDVGLDESITHTADITRCGVQTAPPRRGPSRPRSPLPRAVTRGPCGRSPLRTRDSGRSSPRAATTGASSSTAS